MARDIKIVGSSSITLKDGSVIKLREDSSLRINSIESVKNIDPVAVHLKEVNNIDPLSIDDLKISEVKNIEALEISKLNVTNLPMVNVSVQNLPTLDINVNKVPDITISTRQKFLLPSNYSLRARFLGVEILRLHLKGETMVMPLRQSTEDEYKVPNKSYRQSRRLEKSTSRNHCRVSPTPRVRDCGPGSGKNAKSTGNIPQTMLGQQPSINSGSSLSFGTPSTSFSLSSGTGKPVVNGE